LSYDQPDSPLLRQKDVHAALPIHFLHVAKEAGQNRLMESLEWTRSPHCDIRMEMSWARISHGVTQWGTMSRYPDVHSASEGCGHIEVVSYGHTQSPLYMPAEVLVVI
jgi:hypothetical protein